MKSVEITEKLIELIHTWYLNLGKPNVNIAYDKYKEEDYPFGYLKRQDMRDIIKVLKDYVSEESSVAEKINNSEDHVEGIDEDILEANTKLQRKVQKLQDINRVERKGWREDSRVVNALEGLGESLKDLLETVNLKEYTTFHPVMDSEECAGVIHLTDTHFNELKLS